MARVAIYETKVRAMLSEPQAMRALENKVKEIEAAAIEIYLAERHLLDHNEYLTSFKISRHGNVYRLTNTDREAFWVEFGAHAGGKTPVLGYAPLRRGIDIVASYS